MNRRSDDGVVTAFVLLLLVAIMVILGVVVDGGRALIAHESAVTEADQAARAGADSLSVDELHSGVVEIDDQAAVEAAQGFMAAAGHPGVAEAANGTVTVTVAYDLPTYLLGLVGVDALHVRATASAIDVHGITGAM